MTPTGELMKEHRTIERMLRIVSNATDRLEKGQRVEKELWVDASDFLRNFADKCHHAKEEKQLFMKMMERGVSGEVGPIAVMLREHEDGRAHVRHITEISAHQMGPAETQELVKQSRGYVELLTQHIKKEDQVLYPMANQILTPDDQEELKEGFEKVEKDIMGEGAHERYHRMIEEWEQRTAS
jgi:hemerythrin-like domain-containing protein